MSFPGGPWGEDAAQELAEGPSPLLVELKTWGGEWDGALAADLRQRARARIALTARNLATFGPHADPDQQRWAGFAGVLHLTVVQADCTRALPPSHMHAELLERGGLLEDPPRYIVRRRWGELPAVGPQTAPVPAPALAPAAPAPPASPPITRRSGERLLRIARDLSPLPCRSAADRRRGYVSLRAYIDGRYRRPVCGTNTSWAVRRLRARYTALGAAIKTVGTKGARAARAVAVPRSVLIRAIKEVYGLR